MTLHDKNDVFFSFVDVVAFFLLLYFAIENRHVDGLAPHRKEEFLTEILKYLSHLVDHISHHFHYVARGKRGLRAAKDTTRYECVKEIL